MSDLSPDTPAAGVELMTAEDFFGAELRRELVKLPNGKSVWVREPSAEERDEYDVSLWTTTKKGKPKLNLENATARLVVLCTIHPDGSRMFGDDQVIKLGRSGSSLLRPLGEAIKRLGGIDADEEEDLAKN